MGKDIVYLPTYYAKGKSIPAGQPFWLKSDGTLQKSVCQRRKEGKS